MKKKQFKKVEVKAAPEIKAPEIKAPEVKAPEIKAPEIKAPEVKTSYIEVIDRSKLADLEKQGYVIIEVRSEVKGVRAKTWVLKKGAL